jgi:hypothetical protein
VRPPSTSQPAPGLDVKLRRRDEVVTNAYGRLYREEQSLGTQDRVLGSLVTRVRGTIQTPDCAICKNGFVRQVSN